MLNVIIVGTGAGGATIAKELQGRVDVTMLEAGSEFRPFSANLPFLEKMRKTGLFFDERFIQLLFPAMKIEKTDDKMVIVCGQSTGGTTTLCTGNALRKDDDLKNVGINLDREFDELYKEIPISREHKKAWSKTTNKIYDICVNAGLNPEISPKMGYYEKCTACGRCVLGCPNGVKWDTRNFINTAVKNGAILSTGFTVERIIFEDSKAAGVIVKHGFSKSFFPADIIILAAGGLGTPEILQNSGIQCENRLFVDPVLCVAAEIENCRQNKEISMPFIMQQKNFIVSPYFDYLSFFFNKKWRLPAQNIYGIMIKLADTTKGSISNGKIDKSLTEDDEKNLEEGLNLCLDIFSQLGIEKERTFLGTVNAGHPGGMLPLTENEAESFHHEQLPDNLYIADATLFPDSLGNPPILTIMAMAKRVAGKCIERFC